MFRDLVTHSRLWGTWAHGRIWWCGHSGWKWFSSAAYFVESHQRLHSYTQGSYRHICFVRQWHWNLYREKCTLAPRPTQAYTSSVLCRPLSSAFTSGLPSRSLPWLCFCPGHGRPALIVTSGFHLTTPSAAPADPVSLSWNIFFSWLLWSYIFLVSYLPLMLRLLSSSTACLPSIWSLTEGPGPTGISYSRHPELSRSSCCLHAKVFSSLAFALALPGTLSPRYPQS